MNPSPRPPSTTERPGDTMAEVLRRKTPAERIAIADAMWRSARTMLEHALHAQHPEWEPARLRLEVARRLSHGAF